MQADQELSLSGSWPLVCLVFVGSQLAIWGLAKMALDPVGFWFTFGAIQTYAVWVMYFLIKPSKRLFFNGKRLLICDRGGRKRACIAQPQGFVSPFFIGLRLSRWRSLGLFVFQMDPQEFAGLLRWVRQSPTQNRDRNGKKAQQSAQKR